MKVIHTKHKKGVPSEEEMEPRIQRKRCIEHVKNYASYKD